MEKVIIYNGAKIFYNIIGKGNVVVLLHGFGEDSTIFNSQVEILQQNYTVIIPDLPGSGKSELLDGETVTIDNYAEVVLHLLQFEQVSSCSMLGHSMGGYITLAFAEHYPQILNSFGLIHSTASADSDEKRLSREQAIKLIEAYGAFPFLKNTIPNLFGQAFKNNNREAIAQLIEDGRQFSGKALMQYYSAMMNRPDRTEVLATTSKPVVFVLGTEDTAAPLEMVINQVHLPKISHIHILKDVGHMGMLEAPSELNKILLEFLSYSNYSTS